MINEVLANYPNCGDPVPFGNGHINDTYKAGDILIQRINTDIFKKPEELMSNIVNVTEFLQEKEKTKVAMLIAPPFL